MHDMLTPSDKSSWERFGIDYIGTATGKPFASMASAAKKLAQLGKGEVVSVGDGFKVKTGDVMTHEQATEFVERFDSDPRRGYPRGIASVRHKPLCITNPQLFDKYNQALTVLGLQYWQQPYEKVSLKMPKRKWEEARLKNGLSVELKAA